VKGKKLKKMEAEKLGGWEAIRLKKLMFLKGENSYFIYTGV